MSSVNYLTNAGRLLLAKMLAGNRLVYTRAVATSDRVPDQPELLQDFVSVRQTATTLTAEQQGDYASLAATFSCRDLAESYQLNMIGIYAKIEGTVDDVLYLVTVYDPDDGVVTLPAGQDISYRFVVYDTVADGTLAITVADSAAAPFEHVANPYRHIFSQINDDTANAIVNAGEFSDFSNGQRIVFVPRAPLVGNSSTLTMTGRTYALQSVDLAGHPVSCLFVPHKTYVLSFVNGAFRYVKHDTIEYVNHVGHYWTGTKWKTVIPAGQIVLSAAINNPPGTIPCDGRSLSRTDYPELFDAIGTKYGTDSNSTFNIPDLRGRCAIGVSDSYNLGATGGEETVTLTKAMMPAHTHTASLSISSPAHTHTVTVNSAGAHTHSVSGTAASAGSHAHTGTWKFKSSADTPQSLAYEVSSSHYYSANTGTAGAHTHNVSGTAASAGSHTHTGTAASKAVTVTGSASIASTGGGDAHTNMQPYMALKYYIHTGRSLL